jgi:hypothetical protein
MTTLDQLGGTDLLGGTGQILPLHVFGHATPDRTERVPTASNVGSCDVTWASQPTPLIPFASFRVFRGPHSLGISISRRTHATKKSCAGELKAVCLEKDYEHHPFNCSDPAVDRRAANLAVQHRLGLLSDRRPWPAGSDRVDSRLVQTHLACIAHKS